MEAMGMAIYMGAGPSVMYASQAIEAYDQFKRGGGERRLTRCQTPEKHMKHLE
jgi:hypothetical protein